MKRIGLSLLATALLVGVGLSQSSSQPQAPASAPQDASAAPQHPAMSFTSGTVLRVQLDKTIDAKKAQVGDQVLGHTTDDLHSDPPGLTNKGCKIIGHIVAVTPHQGDTASTMTVVFDKMILKDGYEMKLPATIQAVGFPDTYVDVNNDQTITKMGGNVGDTHAQSGNSNPMANIGSGGGDPRGYGGQRMPSSMPSNSDAKLPMNAQGAVGMAGVTLGAGTGQGTTLTSQKKNVKIESGMQMILRVD